MSTTRLHLKTIVLLAGDLGASALALALAPFIRQGGAPEPGIIALYRFATPFLAVLWALGFVAFGLYDIRTAKNEPAFFERLGRALVFNFALTIGLFYLVPEFRLRPVVTLLVIFALLAVFVASWRAIYNSVLGRLARGRVLFLGINPEAAELAQFLTAHPQLGFAPAGFIALPGDEGAGGDGLAAETIPAPANLAELVLGRAISILVIAHDLKRDPVFIAKLFPVLPLGITITDLPHFYEAVKGKVPVSRISEAWFIENLIGMRRPKYEFAKRILDLTFALTFGLVTIILLPLIAALILLSTPRDIWNHRMRRARKGDGIIFFRQPRVGRGGVIFNFIKFRSQVLGAEALGGEKSRDPTGASSLGSGPDPRAYAAGTFLRRTYLDELPQIWNVIRGEMSFIGPRPERPEFVSGLERRIPFYRMRELVLPGITGWAQINMQNDASVADAPEKLQHDLYYIKNRSLALDATIILKTALQLLARNGR